jgi:acetoin utilization deacetylase AcuC-like enzyme
MRPVLVVKDERYKQHLAGVFHLENPKRIEAAHSMLQDSSLAKRWIVVSPRQASEQELAWVHTQEYIEQVAQTSGMPLASFDTDTQTTEKSYDVARLAAGGVFSLIDEIWSGRGSRGFAFIRPPGHHAEPDKAMGFCLFNNIALGAKYLKERYSVKKVMIVDIDVHHGNGTQKVFYNTDEVLYVSIHQSPCYPGTGSLGEVGAGKGEGFTINIPLREGHRGRDVAKVIHFLLKPVAREYQPEMILVSCGFDLYMGDPLGGMRCAPGGYGVITSLLLEIAHSVCNGRIAFLLEGGYSLRGIKACGLRVMQELCGVSALSDRRIEMIRASSPARLSAYKKALEIHKNYWKGLR